MKTYFLLFSLCCALFGNDIVNRIEKLKEIELKVEIINVYLDLPESTYTWNKIPKSTQTYENISISYLPSNLSESLYYKSWHFLNSNNSLLDFPKPAWSTFQIILLHSTSFPLFQTFQFRDHSTSCECSNPIPDIHEKRLFIKAHPLESISLYTLHDIFIHYLNKNNFPEILKIFLKTLEKSLELFKPITTSDEDTNALFFHENQKFELEFKNFAKNLVALKLFLQEMRVDEFWKISEKVLKMVNFQYWVDELPEKHPSMVVPFVVTVTVFGLLVVIIEILYFKSLGFKTD